MLQPLVTVIDLDRQFNPLQLLMKGCCLTCESRFVDNILILVYFKVLTNRQTIFSDSILEMLRTPTEEISGCLELDEDFLRKRGVTDFSKYSVIAGSNPRRMLPATLPILTVPEEDEEVFRADSTELKPKM